MKSQDEITSRAQNNHSDNICRELPSSESNSGDCNRIPVYNSVPQQALSVLFSELDDNSSYHFSQNQENEILQEKNTESNSNSRTDLDLTSFVSPNNNDNSLQDLNRCKPPQHLNESINGSMNNVVPHSPVNKNLSCMYVKFTEDSFFTDTNVKCEIEVDSLKQKTQDYSSNLSQVLDDCIFLNLKQNHDPTIDFNASKSEPCSSISIADEHIKNKPNKSSHLKFGNETQNSLSIEPNFILNKKNALFHSINQQDITKRNIIYKNMDTSTVHSAVNDFTKTLERSKIFLENNENSHALSKHESVPKCEKLTFHIDETEYNSGSKDICDINPFASFRGFTQRKVKTENTDSVEHYNAITLKCNVKQPTTKLIKVNDFSETFPNTEKYTDNFKEKIVQINHAKALQQPKDKSTFVPKQLSFESDERVRNFTIDNINTFAAFKGRLKSENKNAIKHETKLSNIATQSNGTPSLKSLEARLEKEVYEQQEMPSSISNDIRNREQHEFQFSYHQSDSLNSEEKHKLVNLLENVNEINIQSKPVEQYRSITDVSEEFENLNSPQVKAECYICDHSYRNSTEVLDTMSPTEKASFQECHPTEENILFHSRKSEEHCLSNTPGICNKADVNFFPIPEFMSYEIKSDELKDGRPAEIIKQHFNHHSIVEDNDVTGQYGVLNNSQLKKTDQGKNLCNEYLKIINNFFESYDGFQPNKNHTSEVSIKTEIENKNLFSMRYESGIISKEKNNFNACNYNEIVTNNHKLDYQTLNINNKKTSIPHIAFHSVQDTIKLSLDNLNNREKDNSLVVFDSVISKNELYNFDNNKAVGNVCHLSNETKTNDISNLEHNYNSNNVDINNLESKFDNSFTIHLFNFPETDAIENHTNTINMCSEETSIPVQLQTNDTVQIITSSKKNENTDGQQFFNYGCKNNDKLKHVYSDSTVISDFQNISEQKKETAMRIDSHKNVENNINFDPTSTKDPINMSDVAMFTQMNANTSNISYIDAKYFNYNKTLKIDNINKYDSIADNTVEPFNNGKNIVKKYCKNRDYEVEEQKINESCNKISQEDFNCDRIIENSIDHILKSSGELELHNSESNVNKHINKHINSTELIQMAENIFTQNYQNFTSNSSEKYIHSKDIKLQRIPFVKSERLTEHKIKPENLNNPLNITNNYSDANSENTDSRQNKNTSHSNDDKAGKENTEKECFSLSKTQNVVTQIDNGNEADREKYQSKTFNKTFQTIRKGSFISNDNSKEDTNFNHRTKTTKDKSIYTSDVQLSRILQRYVSITPGTSTSNDNHFGPKRFISQTMNEKPYFSFNDCSEFSSNVIDIIIGAIKKLNSGNGCSVLDILAYIRQNSTLTAANLYDVRKALKDAIAAGLIHYTTGKYTATCCSIDPTNSSRQRTVKRKMNNVNDLKNRILSKKVKPTPQLRHTRRKTKRLTRKTARK
ncbi:hypothetical protein NPIL_276421 [Nephila pilipes]|uniref:H15 domain-containing protein n=1 Tax=Nephila pilipes TaxID=299642 RepID=A0A8X6QUE5_NEPPI|nr:hypothetical protein NPIL_276421 [Nephila pilipes]